DKRRGPGDTDRLPLIEILINAFIEFIRLAVGVKLLDVQACFSRNAGQKIVGQLTAVALGLIGVIRVMKLPEFALLGCRSARLGRFLRILTQVRKVTPLDTSGAVIDVF